VRESGWDRSRAEGTTRVRAVARRECVQWLDAGEGSDAGEGGQRRER
jgi:hypothetical protein